jgi:hypothetical protein
LICVVNIYVGPFSKLSLSLKPFGNIFCFGKKVVSPNASLTVISTEYPRMSHSIGGDLKPLISKLVKLSEQWGCSHVIDGSGNLIIRKYVK